MYVFRSICGKILRNRHNASVCVWWGTNGKREIERERTLLYICKAHALERWKCGCHLQYMLAHLIELRCMHAHTITLFVNVNVFHRAFLWLPQPWLHKRYFQFGCLIYHLLHVRFFFAPILMRSECIACSLAHAIRFVVVVTGVPRIFITFWLLLFFFASLIWNLVFRFKCKIQTTEQFCAEPVFQNILITF